MSRLLQEMIQTVIEHVGAERGLLLVPKHDVWCIEAYWPINAPDSDVLQPRPLEKSGLSPEDIIHHVARTQEELVLRDAALEGDFTQDAYIAKQQPKSLVCMPLIARGKLTGILYLEHSVSHEAFTPKRLEILHLLSPQVAISIEHSSLYKTLEQKIVEFSDEAEARVKEAEEALRHEKLLSEKYINSLPELFYVFDEKRFVRWNTQWTVITGYSSNELADMYGPDFFRGDDRSHIAEKMKEAFTLGSAKAEAELVTKQGERIPYYFRGLRIKINGKSHLIGLGMDIRDRKQAEAALREKDARYRELVEGTGDLIIRVDNRGNFTYVNHVGEEVFGLSPGALIGMSVFEFLHPDDREKTQQWFEHCLQAQLLSASIENRQVNKKTHEISHFLWACNFVYDAEENAVGVNGIAHNVTDRKRVEEALRQSESRYKSLFKNNHSVMLVIDPEHGDIVDANPAACAFYGWDLAELMNKNISDINVLSKEQIFQEMKRAEFEQRRHFAFRHRLSNGEIRDVEVYSGPIQLYGRHLLYSIVHDVSERKQAEEEARKARELAESANRAQSAFLANMSHELRTPLNTILGFAQIMARDSELSDKVKEHLSIIQRSGEHLLILINQVLDLSKIEAGRISLHEKDFDLLRLFDELREMFFLKAQNKGLSLEFEIDDVVPRYVFSDEVKLRQVLINLLSNAMKFTKEGGVHLSVTCRRYSAHTRQRSTEPGQVNSEHGPQSTDYCVLFTLKDTGPGIATGDMDKLFEAFAQSESGRYSPNSTGLGLPISRKFVQLLGGDITVESTVGKGSIFYFHILVGPGNEQTLRSASSVRKAVAVEPGQPRSRMLVVDDEPDNRKLLVRMLSSFDFEIREAKDGQQAIEIWEQWRPHLIWMDVRMPMMDGYETTQKIKELAVANGKKGREDSQEPSADLQPPVIIALSASVFEEERATALSKGCDDFLRKPFRETEMLELLQKYLGIRFVYEGEEHLATGERQDDTLNIDALSALPAELLAQLEQAAVTSNMNKMPALLEDIRRHDPSVTQVLSRVTERFEFQAILKALQQCPLPSSPGQSSTGEGSGSLAVPSYGRLQELYHLARYGDMDKIVQWADALAQADTKYGLFANRLRRLAKDFREQDILTLVEACLAGEESQEEEL